MAAHLRSERGAILIHVATALMSFTMLSAFVIDYGVQLVSRHQIQAAADAAALAGATALAFDSYTDRTGTGPATTAALAVAKSNLVWKGQPSITAGDVSFPACPDSFDAGPSATPILACVKVDLFRNTARGNPLPTYFAQLFGISSASVAASAMAEARDGNATDCIKPIAVPDRWAERTPVAGAAWGPGATFNKWDPARPTTLLAPPDSYTAPSPLSTGTGLRNSIDFGLQVVLTPGTVSSPVSSIAPWKYLPVQIAGSVFGNNVRSNTNSCAAATVAVADRMNLAGNVAATVISGLQDLINRDPGAHWNTATARVESSCADVWPRCASMSPRIIAIALYDPSVLADSAVAPGGATNVVVRNFVGFFISNVSGTSITGYITRHPGLIQPTALTLNDGSTFLRAALLVQ
jgi:hypothetical protein